MVTSILIIGATGRLGKPVAEHLIRAGFKVTILSTNPEKARKLFPETSVVAGNLNDLPSLEKAFSGQDAVYLNISITSSDSESGWNAERDGMRNVIQAARKTGIQRIGYLSSFIMNYQEPGKPRWWVFESKRDAAGQLINSGIPFFLFYASSFMENFTEGMRQGTTFNLAGKSVVPMHFIAAGDYAEQVSAAFRLDTSENREFYIQGPEALTMDQAVKIFIDHYPKEKLVMRTAPMGLLKFLSLFKKDLKFVVGLVSALNNYPETFRAESTWKELGKPETRMKDFAANARF